MSILKPDLILVLGTANIYDRLTQLDVESDVTYKSVR